MTAAEGADYYATRKSALVDALAARGTAVLDAKGLDESEVDALVALVARLTGRRGCRDAHSAFALVEPVDLSDQDEVLLSLVSDILETVARAPSAIHLARITGVASDRLCVCGGASADPFLVDDDSIDDDPLRLLARPALVLNARDPLVASARAAMDVEPVVAAAFVARGVLLATGRLDAKCDDALTKLAIERVLGAGR